jgi:hypothetical protein
MNCSQAVLMIFLLYLFISYSNGYLLGSSFFNKTEAVEYNDYKFYVLSEMPKKEQAAKILYDINKNIEILRTHINNKFTEEYILKEEAKYKGKGKILSQIKRRINKYKRESLKENYPEVKKKDVSYNLNKGSTIALCLRNYDEIDQFHNFNEILFVSIHEIAHSLNCDEKALLCGNSYGHNSMFWYIFKILLENASEVGIYTVKDYKSEEVDYCSMEITYSPLFDLSLEDKYFNFS